MNKRWQHLFEIFEPSTQEEMAMQNLLARPGYPKVWPHAIYLTGRRIPKETSTRNYIEVTLKRPINILWYDSPGAMDVMRVKRFIALGVAQLFDREVLSVLNWTRDGLPRGNGDVEFSELRTNVESIQVVQLPRARIEAVAMVRQQDRAKGKIAEVPQVKTKQSDFEHTRARLPTTVSWVWPEIVEAAARLFFVEAWANEEEMDGREYPGEDLYDVAPETPQEAIFIATRFIAKVEVMNHLTISKLYWVASEMPGVHYKAPTPSDFGKGLAAKALGMGISWEDDHPKLPIRVPSWHYDL